jgi:hypothetical protein
MIEDGHLDLTKRTRHREVSPPPLVGKHEIVQQTAQATKQVKLRESSCSTLKSALRSVTEVLCTASIFALTWFSWAGFGSSNVNSAAGKMAWRVSAVHPPDATIKTRLAG